MSSRKRRRPWQDRPATERVDYLHGETVSPVIVLVERIERLQVGLFEMTGRVRWSIRNRGSPSLYSRVAGQATSGRDGALTKANQSERCRAGRCRLDGDEASIRVDDGTGFSWCDRARAAKRWRISLLVRRPPNGALWRPSCRPPRDRSAATASNRRRQIPASSGRRTIVDCRSSSADHRQMAILATGQPDSADHSPIVYPAAPGWFFGRNRSIAPTAPRSTGTPQR